jgi:tRNA(Ile2)-agmatinylcytidine synthase|tara:strand:- start:563 stop:1675 length:1113 start_codon:yes stop_codon:yes gene_type:complete
MWLGLDDTDSLEGGCTTLVFHELLNSLPCDHGEPRLTRLWPFAAQRTRGNASLSVEIYADDSIVEWLDEYWKENILPLKGMKSESTHSQRKQYPSDPGMTLFDEQPSEDYYWKAVRGEVGLLEGGIQWGGNGRIGAAASCAWRPQKATWEGIAWRKGIREVSDEALIIVEKMDETFLCRDPRTNRGLIAPRGPCPVMFGVRATSRETAKKATQILVEGSAETIGNRVFATNQASGDHIESTIKLTIETKEMLQGGHVILNGNCLAFNESGDVNKIAQWLEIGDEIEFLGLQFEGNYHLEAIRVISSSSSKRPMCECGTRMKSMGKGQGVRCPKCKARSDELWSNEERVPPFRGWVQPPADKRRHLAKTLT